MGLYLNKAAPLFMPYVNLGPPQVRWRGHLVQRAKMKLFSLALISYEGGR